MTSPYLDRPLLPLALALPRMLQEIEAALARLPSRGAASPPTCAVDLRSAHAARNRAALDLTAA
jgi:hypothetical protein